MTNDVGCLHRKCRQQSAGTPVRKYFAGATHQKIVRPTGMETAAAIAVNQTMRWFT